MKNMKLLIIAVVLVLVAFLVKNANQTGSNDSFARNFVPAQQIDKTRTIEIETSQGLIKIESDNGTWRLPDFHNLKANKNRIEELFQKLNSGKLVEIVSENEQKHASLGVAKEPESKSPDTESAIIKLKDENGEPIKVLYLGKGRKARQIDGAEGFGFDGQYVRYADEAKVYLLSELLRIEKLLNNWADRKIIALDTDKIKRISWADPDSNEFAISRESASDSLKLENLEENRQMRAAQVARCSAFFKNLTWDEVIATETPQSHPGLSTATTIVAETFDGFKLNLKIGSGTVNAGSTGKVKILWADATYQGTEPETRNLSEEIVSYSKKLVFGLRENKLASILVNASDLTEDKPAPKPETATGSTKIADEKVSASHILLAFKGAQRSTAERSEEEAKKLADELLKRIKKGESFEKLAKEYSDCPSGKSKGGSLGEFGRKVMAKEFEETSFKLEPGKISEVIKTDFGYHIIRRDK
jgi:parvulin-like peptidyl-prolyl isomerase